jgi:hypothetical protein
VAEQAADRAHDPCDRLGEDARLAFDDRVEHDTMLPRGRAMIAARSTSRTSRGRPMQSLDQARKRLDDEFGQVRRKLANIHEALDKVEAAGPEDDLHGLLADLESVVKEVRDGGLVGSGANGHRRALKEYLELKNG